jgi:hypothetical protein
MKRIVVAAGVAAVVSAALAIRNRRTAATRSTTTVIQTGEPGMTPEAETQFRQRIRAIIQKVEADVKKTQPSLSLQSR